MSAKVFVTILHTN